jgi:uncharacterized protein (DUF1330 family)
MAAYLIAHVKVTDQSWIPEYAKRVHEIAATHGGKYLARSANIKALEGDAPDATLVAVVEFPSMDAIDAFVNDPEYTRFAKARRDGSNSSFYMIDGTDVAGAIPYLPKGG